MPVFFISTLIILFSTINLFVPNRLFPILGYGLNKTFLVGTLNIYSFSSFAYLYFLIPLLKNREEFKKIAISSTIISSVYLLSSIIYLLMLLPFITFSDEMLSIYLVARLIKFGRFFQRIDALFIFIWLLISMSFLSTSIFFISNIYKKLTGIKHYSSMCYTFSFIIFSCALLFENLTQVKYIEDVVIKYLILILVFIVSPIILFLGYLKKKRKLKHET